MAVDERLVEIARIWGRFCDECGCTEHRPFVPLGAVPGRKWRRRRPTAEPSPVRVEQKRREVA